MLGDICREMRKMRERFAGGRPRHKLPFLPIRISALLESVCRIEVGKSWECQAGMSISFVEQECDNYADWRVVILSLRLCRAAMQIL
jgi:hypothetical protein